MFLATYGFSPKRTKPTESSVFGSNVNNSACGFSLSYDLYDCFSNGDSYVERGRFSSDFSKAATCALNSESLSGTAGVTNLGSNKLMLITTTMSTKSTKMPICCPREKYKNCLNTLILFSRWLLRLVMVCSFGDEFLPNRSFVPRDTSVWSQSLPTSYQIHLQCLLFAD